VTNSDFMTDLRQDTGEVVDYLPPQSRRQCCPKVFRIYVHYDCQDSLLHIQGPV